MAPESLCLQEGDYRGKPTHGDKGEKGEPATQGTLLSQEWVCHIQTWKLEGYFQLLQNKDIEVGVL